MLLHFKSWYLGGVEVIHNKLFHILKPLTNLSQTYENCMHLFMKRASCPNYLFITLAAKYMHAVQKRECT